MFSLCTNLRLYRLSTPTLSSRTQFSLKSLSMTRTEILQLFPPKLNGRKERCVPFLSLFSSSFFRSFINSTKSQDLTKKQPSKDKSKRSRDEESESFFTWFNPEDQDLELAEIIKEDLWPNPAKYYLGVSKLSCFHNFLLSIFNILLLLSLFILCKNEINVIMSAG